MKTKLTNEVVLAHRNERTGIVHHEDDADVLLGGQTVHITFHTNDIDYAALQQELLSGLGSVSLSTFEMPGTSYFVARDHDDVPATRLIQLHSRELNSVLAHYNAEFFDIEVNHAYEKAEKARKAAAKPQPKVKEAGVTFYTGKALKDKMKAAQALTGVNWSYELRAFIQRKSEELIKAADEKKAA